MKHVDEKLLDTFRRKTHCEFCGWKGPVEPHHLFAKGMGGGSRLDVAINIISLCRKCHSAHHQGNEPTRFDLLTVIAQRENRLQDSIVDEIHQLLRAKMQ